MPRVCALDALLFYPGQAGQGRANYRVCAVPGRLHEKGELVRRWVRDRPLEGRLDWALDGRSGQGQRLELQEGTGRRPASWQGCKQRPAVTHSRVSDHVNDRGDNRGSREAS